MHAYVYVHVSIWDLSLSQKDNIYSKRNKKNNVLHYCFFFCSAKGDRGEVCGSPMCASNNLVISPSHSPSLV
jgi:hypothetical protein